MGGRKTAVRGTAGKGGLEDSVREEEQPTDFLGSHRKDNNISSLCILLEDKTENFSANILTINTNKKISTKISILTSWKFVDVFFLGKTYALQILESQTKSILLKTNFAQENKVSQLFSSPKTSLIKQKRT